MSDASTDADADAIAARAELERLLATEAPPIQLPPNAPDRLEAYAAALLRANLRQNLTRVTAPADVARLHLLDALSAVRLIDPLAPSTGLDLGSGGGVPGMVLAIARPATRWTLVDAASRKAAALRFFVEDLALHGVEVVAQRAELLGRADAYRERYDLVTARACASLPVLLEYALPLLAIGGTVIAWKGRLPAEELAAGGRAAAVLGGGVVSVIPSGSPALGEHRFITVLKERATPEAYPRRPGVPARRPLG